MDYVPITEAARRCSVGEKAIRRAIRDGKLTAHYPTPDLCEIAVSELETFNLSNKASRSLETRLSELEERVNILEQLVSLQLGSSSQLKIHHNQRPERTKDTLPQGFLPLRDFVERHCISESEVLIAHEMGLLPVECGEWINKDGKVITRALDATGRQAFYQLYHGVSPFLTCEQCPHDYW